MYTTGRALLRPRFVDSKVITRSKSVRPLARESLTISHPPNLLQRTWQAYTKSLHERPLLTKATFAASIFFLSDSATQYIVCDDRALFQWNASRALSGAGFGMVATGWLHYWWGFLEAAVGRRLPFQTHRLANTTVKVLIDQSIGAPLYIYTYYVLTNMGQAALSGSPDLSKAWQETNARAQAMLGPTMLKHWRLWVPVHMGNFYFVPLHHRVLVQNTVLTFWSGYLSHLNHQARPLQTPDEEMKDTMRQDAVLVQQALAPIQKQATSVLASSASTKES